MVSRLALENVSPIGEGGIDPCPSRLVIDRRSKLSVTVLSGSEVAANIPKLNGTAKTDSDVRRMAAMLEDRNRSVEY